MKKRKLFTLLCLLFASYAMVSACEITFKVAGEAKESYKVGDELIVEVHLSFTHRACAVSVKDTKFEYQGVKILGATDWEKVSDMEYTRKLKVVITDVKDGKKTFVSALRSCDKEGGLGSFEIKRD